LRSPSLLSPSLKAEDYPWMTDHLRPTAPIFERALLPGDPGRAMALAQDLLEAPRMANHARGLWGYSGSTPGGEELTIQSTGVGGPSVAVVVSELAQHGMRRAVRIGTCRAVSDDLEPGAFVCVGAAVAADGAGAALAGAGQAVAPDAELTAALASAAGLDPVTIASTDLYYEPEGAKHRPAGVVAIDLGSAAALASGGRLGVAMASALVVTRAADGRALGDSEVESRSLKLGRAAAAALG
jgi:uridine phosphorylase